jgi:acyl carrier protein
MNIRNIVLARLEQAVAEHSPMPFPEEMDDDFELDMFGLDSLAFMDLLTGIEKDVGYIPRAILEGDLYPETFGELVSAYDTDGS